MKLFFNFILLIFLFLIVGTTFGQQAPVWPIEATVTNYNQINATFAEKHSQFHGGIDTHTGNEEFLAILDGKVFNNASTNNFFVAHHELMDQADINSNLKKVRYGDVTDNLPGVNNLSIINQSQAIGEVVATSNLHLHFEMWVRACTNDCDWYLVDPLNNPYFNYENLPPGTTDAYDVELNDVILEPQGNTSGIIFTAGNGLTPWHFNSCKIHKQDRPDSQGDIHSYGSSTITVFGDILPSIHVRDTEVTNGTNSTGEGLGIHECMYHINDDLKYWVKFDELQEVYKPNWATFFNHKYNTAEGTSVLFGNHDYIKMHRLTSDRYTASHKVIDRGIWRTRGKQGNTNLIADLPINANYIDNTYDVNFSVQDAAGNSDDAINIINVDNFQPFITSFQLATDVFPGAETAYELHRTQSEGSTSLNDGVLKNTNTLFNEPNTDFTSHVSIRTSEPMDASTMEFRFRRSSVWSPWTTMTNNEFDVLKWDAPFTFDNTADCYLFEFRGDDKSGNPLIDVYSMTGENRLNTAEIVIPTRASNTTWNNPPSDVGSDFFFFCPDCGNVVNESDDACDDIDDFQEQAYRDCNGNLFVSLVNVDNSISDQYDIEWDTDLDGEYESNFGEFTIPANIGLNCYALESPNGCCLYQGCIEVTGEERFSDNFTYDFQDVPDGTKAITVSVEGASGLAYPIRIDYLDDQGNEACIHDIISNPEQGASCVGLIVGENYCIRFTGNNGCIYENCFTVPNENCIEPIFISVDNITPECNGYRNGSISVNVSSNTCNEYNIAWDSGDIGPIVDDLPAGTHCVYVLGKGDCEDCQSIACFEVGVAPAGCDQDLTCEQAIANQVLIDTDFIFFNTSTNTCEGGSFNFDASGSTVFPVEITPVVTGGDGCIAPQGVILSESNPQGGIFVSCKDINMNSCGGEYCFEVKRDGCPAVTFCRHIDDCSGKSRNAQNLACLEDGGSSGNSNLKAPSANGEKPAVINTELVQGQPVAPIASLELLKIFPNPFTAAINIRLESIDNQEVQLQITDMYGRLILQNIHSLQSGENFISLELASDLASGIYALTIIDQDQKRYTELITKMNN